MNSIVKLSSAVVIALVLNPSSAPITMACTCVHIGGARTSIRGADVVIAGIVTEITRPEDGLWPFANHVAVVASWIEGVPENVVVFSDYEAGCGYRFRPGEQYVIYARRHPRKGHLFAEACSGTRLFDSAIEDRYFLGPVKSGTMEPVTLETIIYALDASPEEARSAALALRRVKPPVELIAPILLDIGRGGRLGDSALAISVLTTYRTEAIAYLPELLAIYRWPARYKPEVRAAALRTAVAVSPDFFSVRSQLVSALSDEAPEVRAVPLGTSHYFGQHQYGRSQRKFTKAAVKGLEDADPQVREQAIWMLTSFGEVTRHIGIIQELASSDPDRKVRHAAETAIEIAKEPLRAPRSERSRRK